MPALFAAFPFSVIPTGATASFAAAQWRDPGNNQPPTPLAETPLAWGWAGWAQRRPSAKEKRQRGKARECWRLLDTAEV